MTSLFDNGFDFSIFSVFCVSISVAIATEDLKLNPIQLSKVAAPGLMLIF